MTNQNLEQHKAQLETWWGEAADSFPGEFHEWLGNRIQEKLEDEDTELLYEDMVVYWHEINQKPTQIDKLSFRGDNPIFVKKIAQKFSISTKGLSKLAGTDSNQIQNWVEKKLAQLRKEGKDIKLFITKKGPVFAAYTNDNFDVFGFFKVIYNGEIIMRDFARKNERLF